MNCHFRTVRQRKGSSPLVRRLIDRMNEQGVGVMELCKQAGITKSAFANWKRSAPLVETLEACANVLGYRLELVPMESTAFHKEIKTKKEYTVTTPSGQEIDVIGMAEFCRRNELNLNQMYRIANTGKTHKGFMVRK